MNIREIATMSRSHTIVLSAVIASSMNIVQCTGYARLLKAAEIDSNTDHSDAPVTEKDALDLEKPTTPLPHKKLVNSLQMQFTYVPEGEFIMAVPDIGYEDKDVELPETTRHRVTLSSPFYISVYETTQADFTAVMGFNPSWHSADGGGKSTDDTSQYPVEYITWEEARQFCQALSEQAEERAAGRIYRLPTEAEWEYVCRAGSSSPYRLFVERQPGDQTGENAGKEKSVLPIQKVGRYPANAFGVYDMRGNAWEWCNDWYSRDYYAKSPVKDPTGPKSGLFKVVRGIDWAYVGVGCRITRDPSPPWQRSPFLGFRVVCELQQHVDPPNR